MWDNFAAVYAAHAADALKLQSRQLRLTCDGVVQRAETGLGPPTQAAGSTAANAGLHNQQNFTTSMSARGKRIWHHANFDQVC